MKKVFMALLTVLTIAGLALAATNVGVKCYPDQYAYYWAPGGWSNLSPAISAATTSIRSQTDAYTTYSWGCGYWSSSATAAGAWLNQMQAKYGNGTINAPKLGMTWYRWTDYPGMAFVPNVFVAGVDYKYSCSPLGSTAKQQRLIMHELGHIFRNDSYHCGTTSCPMYYNPTAGTAASYCTNCRNVINGRY